VEVSPGVRQRVWVASLPAFIVRRSVKTGRGITRDSEAPRAPHRCKRFAPKGTRAHYTVHYTESAKSGLRFLLAFVALCARLPVLSGTFEGQTVVAGTLGEPPTRSRHLFGSALFYEGCGAIARAIEAFTTRLGHASTFHTTITLCRTRLVAAGMTEAGSCTTPDELISGYPALPDERLLLRPYSKEVGFSEKARTQWAEPDIESPPRVARTHSYVAMTAIVKAGCLVMPLFVQVAIGSLTIPGYTHRIVFSGGVSNVPRPRHHYRAHFRRLLSGAALPSKKL
jgi:hypothetical protein